MAVDPEYLRKHYASLSDEALLDINPEELVPAARSVLEAELENRQLDGGAVQPAEADEEFEAPLEIDEEEPDWVEEGAEIYSAVVRPGSTTASQAHHARRALEAAGIPCFLDVVEEEPEPQPETPETISRWRVLVPGGLNIEATNILQRDLFNDDFEAGWKTHLEVLSDEELLAVDPRRVFCGIYDQIDRINRTWNEELKLRRLK